MNGHHGADEVLKQVSDLIRKYQRREALDLEDLSKRLHLTKEKTQAALEGRYDFPLQELSCIVDLMVRENLA